MVCPPLWWWCVPGACAVPCFCSQHPVFAPSSSEVAVGFFLFVCLVFLYLVVQDLPQLCVHTVIFSPYGFFVFCCSRRLLSRCKHCSEGSQVSGPSLSHFDYFCQNVQLIPIFSVFSHPLPSVPGASNFPDSVGLVMCITLLLVNTSLSGQY